jgi:ribose transport system permease protein
VRSKAPTANPVAEKDTASAHRQGDPPPSGSGRLHRINATLGVGRCSGLYVLAILIIIFTIWEPGTFFTLTTLQTVGENQVITGLLAVGVIFSLSAGAFDVSFANVFGLCSMIVAKLTAVDHVNVAVAIIVTIAIGLVIGAVNGVLVAVLGINSIVATLGMSSICLAGTEGITGNNIVIGIPNSLQDLGNNDVFGVPLLVIYLAVAAVVVWYLLEHTPFGRNVYAIGYGLDAARLAGVRVKRTMFMSLAISGTLSAIAGVVVTGQIAAGSPTLYTGYLLPVFAALFLGATQIKVGRFNVWGTIISIYLLAVGVKGLQLAGGSFWVSDLFNGVALIVAVGVSLLAGNWRFGVWRLLRRGRADDSA